jgi:hypothetical protein
VAIGGEAGRWKFEPVTLANLGRGGRSNFCDGTLILDEELSA